jgi:hypothetical protein
MLPFLFTFIIYDPGANLQSRERRPARFPARPVCGFVVSRFLKTGGHELLRMMIGLPKREGP